MSILYGISITFFLFVSLNLLLLMTDFYLNELNQHLLSLSLLCGLSVPPYFKLMQCLVSLAPALLPEMSHLSATCACLSIGWALSWNMDPTTVAAWVSLTCHVGCLSQLTFFWLLGNFDFCQIDVILLCHSIQWPCTLCASILFAHVSTPSLVTCSSLFLVVSSLIISSIINLSLNPCIICSLAACPAPCSYIWLLPHIVSPSIHLHFHLLSYTVF